MSLTKRQREILTYLSNYSEEHGYAPSFEEIATQFNYNSLATVHEHLTNLERKGYIKRAYNESRGIELVPSDVFPRAASLPLLGTVAAGMPIDLNAEVTAVQAASTSLQASSDAIAAAVAPAPPTPPAPPVSPAEPSPTEPPPTG